MNRYNIKSFLVFASLLICSLAQQDRNVRNFISSLIADLPLSVQSSIFSEFSTFTAGITDTPAISSLASEISSVLSSISETATETDGDTTTETGTTATTGTRTTGTTNAAIASTQSNSFLAIGAALLLSIVLFGAF